MTIVFVILFSFSLFTLLTAKNNLALSLGLLRTALSVLGIVSVRFDQEIVTTISVLLYSVISLTLLSITRSEVQLQND